MTRKPRHGFMGLLTLLPLFGACSDQAPTQPVESSSSAPVAFGSGSGSGESFTLQVLKSGSGSGQVTSSPSGIDCGSSCSRSFPKDTRVTLSATPDAGSVFGGWSGGGCSGTGTCTTRVDRTQTVT